MAKWNKKLLYILILFLLYKIAEEIITPFRSKNKILLIFTLKNKWNKTKKIYLVNVKEENFYLI